MMFNGILTAQRLKISPEQVFVLSAILVNGGNYLYNLILGRFLGPREFADASVLITFLLILSFAAMTFQLIAAKFVVQFDQDLFASFRPKLIKYALVIGLTFGIVIIACAPWLQSTLNTRTSSMFVVFAFGVPVYFYLSVARGVFHGREKYVRLSLTYQLEMIGRLLLTMALLLLVPLNSATLVALGVVLSLFTGLIPVKRPRLILKKKLRLTKEQGQLVRNFVLVTVLYELTQIIINNSDILLVKHYFADLEAGLYASLALIGRAVYFVTWMFIMLLLPKVIEAKKKGQNSTGLLFKNIRYTTILCGAIVLFSFCFPESIVQLLFGSDYIAISPLLWKYALATSFFAISNIFAYYYLSLERYFAVFLCGIFGVLQIVGICWFHESLSQVVNVQIVIMLVLLFLQVIHFKIQSKKM